MQWSAVVRDISKLSREEEEKGEVMGISYECNGVVCGPSRTTFQPGKWPPAWLRRADMPPTEAEAPTNKPLPLPAPCPPVCPLNEPDPWELAAWLATLNESQRRVFGLWTDSYQHLHPKLPMTECRRVAFEILNDRWVKWGTIGC